MRDRLIVGLAPWLPWPFSASPWWTEPVRAERLAALRIGFALCLLLDICLTFVPHTLEFFAKDGPGNPKIFAWRFEPSSMAWSLLRGCTDETTSHLSLLIWMLTMLWALGNSLTRLLLIHRNPPPQDQTGLAVVVGTCASAWYVVGLWARMIAANEPGALAWIIPLIGLALTGMLWFLELLSRLRSREHRILWYPLLFALIISLGLFGTGFALEQIESYDASAWQDEDALLMSAMALWIVSAIFLLVGCFTRLAAVLTWLLSMSFGNLNPYLLNAGDTVHLIVLFYLMLCPCGAVWSVDSWREKRSAPVYVSPWPIRLLFVQLVIIYFANGVCKVVGSSWLEGSSLHYILGDLTLTRFSRSWLPMPILLTRILSWSVLLWELSFPFLVLWPWPRRIALAFGVFFHLGIFATMELAGFVPYMLCLYLPLIPWERWTNSEKSTLPLDI